MGSPLLGFLLSLGAGLCTGVGGLIVFTPLSASLNKLFLAASLSASGGVMLWVSFVELLAESEAHFSSAGHGGAEGALLSTLAFFSGALLVLLLDILTHALLHYNETGTIFPPHPAVPRPAPHEGLFAWARHAWLLHSQSTAEWWRVVRTGQEESTEGERETLRGNPPASLGGADGGEGGRGAHAHSHSHGHARLTSSTSSSRGSAPPAPLAVQPPGDVDVDVEAGTHEEGPARIDASTADVADEVKAAESSPQLSPRAAAVALAAAAPAPAALPAAAAAAAAADGGEGALTPPAWVREMAEADEEHSQLGRLGLLSAIALGLHNLPEGSAAFTGALATERVGVVLAVAVATHNVFEGVAVAVPIYYATRSKWKALLWALLSGLAEPVGALLTWAIVTDKPSDAMFGSTFAFVAGLMVYVAMSELIPTARKYDPRDRVTTKALFLGMGVMALSLVLLRL
jgi:zinc transporter ZupT